MDKDCKTCKYKETTGKMVDPCFPCLQEYSLWTNEPKKSIINGLMKIFRGRK